jgi:hypothetical protein
MNSKLQGDPKATEPDFEILRQSLDRLELLITTNFSIVVLILSCTGTGDDSMRAALLRIKHGKVYVYGIWGCHETKLEVFDTTTMPKDPRGVVLLIVPSYLIGQVLAKERY